MQSEPGDESDSYVESYSIHPQESGVLPGQDPNKKEDLDGPYIHPMPEHIDRHWTQTDVEQPGRDFGRIPHFPIGSMPVGLYFSYKEYQSKEFSKKEGIKAEMLPTEGRISYIPPDWYHPDNPLPKAKGDNMGFKDKFGNIWTKGPSRT